MYTDRPVCGETVDTGVDSALSAPPLPTPRAAAGRETSGSETSGGDAAGRETAGRETAGADAAATHRYLDPASTTERLRLLWSTGARDVTLVAPGDGEGHRQPGAIDPRGWIA